MMMSVSSNSSRKPKKDRNDREVENGIKDGAKINEINARRVKICEGRGGLSLIQRTVPENDNILFTILRTRRKMS